MTGHEIRAKFIEYFVAQGHRHVRSSSLVPHGDPTLLFTNAGMNQFKDVFLGLEQRDYKRAVTSQKCVRAGGKHNDLENVGFTNRHHTFFEMLGNFSFGDYFKKDAIAFAWELITSPNWYGISKDKLYATIFQGEGEIPRDEEAEKHWLAAGVPPERVHALGMKDNFWAMGDTGPCGPCSELHYDMGPGASDQGHADCAFACDCGRYVEIWNLVFMQFNRDASGALTPLPRPCVDTGMGLERITAVLQGKLSNFETDLFMPLITFAGKACGKSYGADKESDVSLRILADHSRAAAFLISDGVLPSNEGRGYVLRKIIRRAVRHARMLGLTKPFLFELAAQVADLMKGPYPELLESAERIARVIKHEEELFSRTIDVGLRKLEEMARRVAITDESAAAYQEHMIRHPEKFDYQVIDGKIVFKWPEAPRPDPPVLSGEGAFELYDTYGLPRDFIEDVTRDAGIKVDWVGFDRAMAEQRERSKASWKGVHKEAANPAYAKLAETFRTEPDFYYGATTHDCRIEAIITKQGSVNEIAPGADAEIVLDRTSIYAESGGQVADTGAFFNSDHTQLLAQVTGAYYPVAGLIAHRVTAKEKVCVGDRVATVADGARREHIKRNHTATHLMHAALRNILGTHVKQAGSINDDARLRFDFSHFAAVDSAELRDIEQQVNEEILRNLELQTDVTNIDDALASGALAFFGDKYPEQNVRVVTIPDPAAPRGFYSKELCGGTHVRRTGDIGVFRFTAEQSVAAGVRRVEAITGERALADYQSAIDTLARLGQLLNVGSDRVAETVERLVQEMRQLEKQMDGLKRKAAHSLVDDLFAQARMVKDVRVLSARVDGVDRAALRQLADSLRQKLGSGVVVLGTTEDGKVALISAVTKDLTSRVHAGKIVQALAQQVGGSGGGRPDLAEAGGKDTSALEKAIAQVYEIVASML